MRAVLLCLALTAACASRPETHWQVAITIDDVPMTGGADCDPDAVMRVNDALIDTLGEYQAPAVAFVVPGASCQGRESVGALAARWRVAGHEVGNHTFSHPDYNLLDAEAFLADAQAGHDGLELVLRATGQHVRWFRPPLLHAGAGPERRAALSHWLTSRDYQLGVVTIDNQEWVYAAAYERALAHGDAVLASRIVDGYLAHLQECVVYYRALSRRVFSRDIPQVLLLHANRLNGDHLSAVLALLRASGARFVTLREAVADDAYAAVDDYAGPRGLSWLQRWALAAGVTPAPEPREADWVAQAAR